MGGSSHKHGEKKKRYYQSLQETDITRFPPIIKNYNERS